MLYRLIQIKNCVLDIMFPPLCLHCKKFSNSAEIICRDCLTLIGLNNSLYCPICRARLAENKIICAHDAKQVEKHPYLLAAATNYNNLIVKDLIRYLKYKGLENAAPILGEIILNYFKTIDLFPEPVEGKFFKEPSSIHAVASTRPANNRYATKNYIVVPIPLFFYRKRKRGFNQSELIAKHLAQKLNLELKNTLVRIKPTKSQTKINKIEWLEKWQKKIKEKIYGPKSKEDKYEKRRKNVEGAFKIIDAREVGGKNILLVDDVYTSGATMNEAARVLKSHGARKIIAVAAAKA